MDRRTLAIWCGAAGSFLMSFLPDIPDAVRWTLFFVGVAFAGVSIWLTISKAPAPKFWKHRVDLFVAMMALGGVLLLGGVAGYVIKRTSSDVPEWTSLMTIALRVGDAEIVRRRTVLHEEVETLEARALANQRRLGELSPRTGPTGPMTPPETDELVALRESIMETNSRLPRARNELREVQLELVEDIRLKLAAGGVVAKGFAAATGDEITIPAGQWRVLRFTSDEAASGGAFGYVGLQFGRPRNSPLQVNE